MQKRSPLLLGVLLVLFSTRASAGNLVAVNASANSEYTKRKFADGKPLPETYVFMAGNFITGTRVDRSIDKMTFRQIGERLAPELARQQYFPTRDIKTADLLLVVHWGTTMPFISINDIRANNPVSVDTEKQFTSDLVRSLGLPEVFSNIGDADVFATQERITEGLDRESQAQSNAQLLGYAQEFRHFGNHALPTSEELTLRANMEEERYFIIIKAYELRDQTGVGQKRRSVWTLYLNMRSPGQNFNSALANMGSVAVDFMGRNSDGVKMSRPTERKGTVTLAPLIILGEVK